MMMKFDELPEFQKDCIILGKKYKSLADDLREFRSVVSAIPLGSSKHFIIITQIKDLYIVKARLFCRYLKGSSLRVMHAYFEKEQRIEFIEVYFKGNRETKNEGRLREYLSSYQD